MKLTQTHRGEKKVFFIKDTSLKITTESSYGIMTRNIPFEKITDEFVALKFNIIHYLLIIIFVVLLLLSFLILKMYNTENVEKIYGVIVPLVIGGAFGVYNFKTATTVLRCIDYEGIEFYKDTPTRKELNNFIKQIFESRNKYLEKNYSKVNPNLNYEFQYEMFLHLNMLEIIDSEQLDQLMLELNNTFSERFIGFSKN